MLLSADRARPAIANPWGGSACPSTDPTLAQRHRLDDLIDGGGAPARSGKTSNADLWWHEAYGYARSLCFPLPYTEGDRLLEAGRVRAAFAQYLAVDDTLNPTYLDNDLQAPWSNGMQAGIHGDLAAAQQWFRKAIKLAPPETNGFPEAHFMLGVTLYAQGLHAQAVDEWRATLAQSGPAVPMWPEAGNAWPSALRFYGIAHGWNREKS
jgi:TolA-binding protein